MITKDAMYFGKFDIIFEDISGIFSLSRKREIFYVTFTLIQKTISISVRARLSFRSKSE